MEKNHQRQQEGIDQEMTDANVEQWSYSDYHAESDDNGLIGNVINFLSNDTYQPDYWQVYNAETNHGYYHVYVQPYDGKALLPGEHHILLEGSIPNPVWLENGSGIFSSPKWRGDDKNFALRLNKKENKLKEAVKKIKFDWPIGTTKISHPWAIQCYNYNDHYVKIEVKAGRYGGMKSYKVGILEVQDTIHALQNIISTDKGEKQIPPKQVSYRQLADEELIDSLEIPEVPAANLNIIKQLITQFFTPRISKKIFLGDLSEEKEQAFRSHVMPAEYAKDEIVAAVDTTIFGSAKDGIVFTPTHFLLKESDTTIIFSYDDFIGVESEHLTDKGEAIVKLKEKTIYIPLETEKEIYDLIKQIALTR